MLWNYFSPGIIATKIYEGAMPKDDVPEVSKATVSFVTCSLTPSVL